MELHKDSCACGHTLDQHDGGRGAPCNGCGCSSGEAPTGFEAGVTDYVTKPFKIPQLAARVRACLARIQPR